MCNINHPKFPCRICAKNVHDKDKAVQCDLCELCIHIKCNISFGVFLDLQKAFDTVDHQILLAKLNQYGIRGVSNDWFKSYLSNLNQYVSINGFDSGITTKNCGVSQGSVLGPFLFLLYVNDLNQAIKFYKVHHFADGTNLLCLSNSIKKTEQTIQCRLKASS